MKRILELADRAVFENGQSVGPGSERIPITNKVHIATPVAAAQFQRFEHLPVGCVADVGDVATIRAHGHKEPENEAAAMARVHHEVARLASLGQIEGWKCFGNDGGGGDGDDRLLPAYMYQEDGQ